MTNHLLSLILALTITGCTSHQKLPVSEVEKLLMGNLKAVSGFTNVNGQFMHYYEAGEGEPMILIHGWLCSGSFWKNLMPELTKKYHVYSIDTIGHGLSSKSMDKAVKFSTENQAEWIIEFIKQKKLRNVYLTGHSMGGEIAAKIGLKAPELIKKIVLIDAVGLKKNPTLLPWYAKIALKSPSKKPLAWFFSKTLIEKLSKMMMSYKENTLDDTIFDDIILQNTNTSKDLKALVKTTKEGLFQDFIDSRVTKLTTPVLCLWAKYDKVVPLEMGKSYNLLIPDSKLIVIDKAGHMLPIEKPDEVIDAISSFCHN